MAPIHGVRVSRSHFAHRSPASKPPIELLPLLLVFYSFLLLPPEVEITVFGVNLPSYRLALIPVSVFALWTSMQRKYRHFGPIDASVALIGFWILISFSANYGFGEGIIRGLGVVIDTVISYFVARVFINSLNDLRIFLILCAPGIAFAGLIMAAESLSGSLILRPLFASIFGGIDSYVSGEAVGVLNIKPEYRLGGLLRAYGPFPHPILGSAALVGFLPLYYFSGLRSWPLLIGITASLCGFFGLSSAGFLAMMLSIGAIIIFHIMPFIPKMSWWTVSIMLITGLVALHLASENGISAVIARFTLTPGTAYYRMLIWEFGSKSVLEHPWFGIGYADWERPSWMYGQSVDAHFLALAMRDGLIVPILLSFAIVYGVVRLGILIPFLSARDRIFAIGINISVINFVLVGQTVTYVASVNLIFMSMIAFLASTLSWAERERLGMRRQGAVPLAGASDYHHLRHSKRL